MSMIELYVDKKQESKYFYKQSKNKQIMKDEKAEKYWEEDETVELDIEDITEIQGGINDDEISASRSCGLGCILGTGSGII